MMVFIWPCFRKNNTIFKNGTMKNYIYISLFLISFTAIAQIPSGYYDSATGTGYALKTQLKNIIDGDNDGLATEFESIDLGYNALWTTYVTSDSDDYYENNGTVLDMYSEKPSGTDSYEYDHFTDQDMGSGGNAEGQFYNREHIIPQAVFNQVTPQRSDAHFVTPSDKYVNGQRGSFPFGVVQNATLTTSNNSKLGNNLDSGYSAGYTATVFEPIDEFKGDIARMHFYFATRYEDNVAGYTYTMFNGTSDQVFEDTFLSILLTWHAIDPVSQRELDRNDAIFARQNNRNPFIDHPEFVNTIWGTVDTEAPTVPTNLMVSNEASNSIDVSWTASTDNTAVTGYDVYVDGVFDQTVTITNATVTGLSPETTYAFTVLAKDAAGNSSTQSSAVNGTTTATSGNSCGGGISANETFANIPTTSSSSYTNRTWIGNDGAMWTATEARTDQTITDAAITLDGRGTDNGTLTSPTISGGIGSLTVKTQRKFSGTTGTFNVYVNGNLAGTIAYDETVQTLSINDINIEGNITVVITEDSGNNRVAIDDLTWTCFEPLSVTENNFSGLHIYPNPSKGNIYIDMPNISEDLEIKVFDITGKLILITDIDRNRKNTMLFGLPKGMLLIELTSSKRSIIKKIIVN